ncbi:hypothetical protein F3Y22_tig00111191pilonHSYRG00240 [Hibiscus syriacus]|uniref:Uncharacterized protein n=1 Tax=Hibiscus syriacus TaxID=106335 RepID=A0A6A2YWS6_HIBSY|nr:hypothetical protein F3Y22_tig00111191pilonHSYRG00240 [Hibiscus syriacus]
MASFKVFLCISLHVLFLVSSSGTRLFSTMDLASIMDPKSEYKASTYDGMEVTYRYSEPVAAGEHSEAAVAESKRTLVEEGREAIKASIQRNGGMTFESKRTSPGGPDPQHH